MENKLKEGEFLEGLDELLNYGRLRISHSERSAKYLLALITQLKEIVKEHFQDSTGYNDLLSKSVIAINSQKALLKEQSKEITRLLMQGRKMEQQKPRVSRKEYDFLSQVIQEYELTGNTEEIDIFFKEIGVEVRE